jgi:hypothetical protein
LTAMDADAEHGPDAIAVGGFTVLTAPAADHVLLLVSDLAREDLEPLAEVMSNLLVPQIKAADSISVPNDIAHRQMTTSRECDTHAVRPINKSVG